MLNILVATNNKGKLLEVKEILGDFANIISLKEFGIHIDVEEDKETFEENSAKKALEIGKIANVITISDDSGIEIPALNNWPGVYTKRIDETRVGDGMSDDTRNRYILSKCENIEDRTVIWKTCIAIYIPQSNITEVFSGVIEGVLPKTPYGDNGFGFDSIFELKDKKKTLACLTKEEKNLVSSRKIALLKLKEYLIEKNM